MIKAVIFDFDGVIHNTLELAYNTYKTVFKNNISLNEYKDIFNGNIYKNKKISPAKISKFFELQKEEFKNLKIKRNIKAELLKLKDKYVLYIISSNKEETLYDYFENNNTLHIFNEVLGFETHKSKGKKFKILFEKHDLDKENSIFVTDTLGDILEANKAGLRTIAVDFGFHERERLEKGDPIKIISNFEKILPTIEEISN